MTAPLLPIAADFIVCSRRPLNGERPGPSSSTGAYLHIAWHIQVEASTGIARDPRVSGNVLRY